MKKMHENLTDLYKISPRLLSSRLEARIEESRIKSPYCNYTAEPIQIRTERAVSMCLINAHMVWLMLVRHHIFRSIDTGIRYVQIEHAIRVGGTVRDERNGSVHDQCSTLVCDKSNGLHHNERNGLVCDKRNGLVSDEVNGVVSDPG